MSIFETTIGWLAPTQCIGCGREGSVLCELCWSAEVLPHGERCGICGILSPSSRTCANCKRSGAPGCIWVSTDYEGVVKALMQAYKYGHSRAAAGPISQVMAETFLSFNEANSLNKANYLIVAVPTATSRVRQRSFDHSSLLAKHLSKQLNLPLYPALSRHGQARQVGAKRNVRLTQPAGKYFVPRSDKVAGHNILLIDDVITTGGTLKAVYKVLRQAGAKRVDALVFAKRL